MFSRLLHSQAVYCTLLFFFFFGLLWLRRSEQMLHPQVWDEDGVLIIPGLLSHGLRSIFDPVGGYLVLVPKLISAASLGISGLYYPLVSTIFAWAFTAGVCVAISVSPIWLRGGALLGVMTVFIPSNPEVFGVPLYTFWWASLLLFLVVLWKPNSTDIAWRTTFTLLGGLSSPVILLVAPFLMLRAVIWRDKRRELAIAAMAFFCAVVQARVMWRSRTRLATGTLDVHNLRLVLPKFIGGYFAGNFIRTTNHLIWIASAVFLVFLVLASPLFFRKPQYLLLIALWCGAVSLVASRIDLSLVQQRDAGPRYFFLPFVLLAWLLVSIMVESKGGGIKFCVAVLLLVSLLNMRPVRTRTQRDFRWAEQVAHCDESSPYPMQISGNGQTAWTVPLSQDQCRALQQAGWFHLHKRNN
jgi:hypothetical protein